jgi:hypothetical protein
MNKLITLSMAAIIVCTCCFFALPLKKESPPAGKGFAVVELFTSEGCSSCPSADEAVIQLSKDYPEQVYILGFHVDYWNYIGWKDEYSSAAFSERQRQYGERFSLNSIYTPQIVVNGQKEFVGSNRGQLKTSVNEALKSTPSDEIKLSLSKENATTLRVNYEVTGGAESILNIALVQLNAITAVKKGENKGKSLHHINIVRALKSMQVGNGAKAVIEIPVPRDLQFKDVEVIAYLQNKKDWKIIAATLQKPE